MAAGIGTRMKSATPKHLHPLLGRRMVDWVIDAARGAGVERVVVVARCSARRGPRSALRTERANSAGSVMRSRNVSISSCEGAGARSGFQSGRSGGE